MKKVIIFLCAMIFATCLLAAKGKINGWDKAEWGMSAGTVKELYSSDGITEDESNPQNLIIFKKNINGKICEVSFRFDSDKLYKVTIMDTHSSLSECEKAIKSFREQYGRPSKSVNKVISPKNLAIVATWNLSNGSVECWFDKSGDYENLILTYKGK